MIILLLMCLSLPERSSSVSTHYELTSCTRHQHDIEWNGGKTFQTLRVNLTMCDKGMQFPFELEVLRPENSSQAIQAKIVLIEGEGDPHFYIHVYEKNEENRFMRKKMSKVGDTITSSATTSLELILFHDQMRNSVITFQFSLLEKGCPYPFLESRLGSHLLIPRSLLSLQCDFSVAAQDTGAALELTSIDDSYKGITVDIIDAWSYAYSQLYKLDRTNFKDYNMKHLGTSSIFVHLSNPLGEDMIENGEPLMTISSIVDDCECPEGSVVLNETKSHYEFKMKKPHCFHLNCSVAVEIEEDLQGKYRLAIWHHNDIYESLDTFVMMDGFINFINLRPFGLNDDFMSVHPRVLLFYNEDKQVTHGGVRVRLNPMSKEEQAHCVCPPFNVNLSIAIDSSCTSIDCLWTLPKLEMPSTISVRSNWTWNLHEELNLISAVANRTIRQLKLMNGSTEELDISEKYKVDKDLIDSVLHYRRHRLECTASKCEPTVFQVFISSQSFQPEQGHGKEESGSKSISFWPILFLVLLVLVIVAGLTRSKIRALYRSYAPVSLFGNRDLDEQNIGFELE